MKSFPFVLIAFIGIIAFVVFGSKGNSDVARKMARVRSFRGKKKKEK